MKERKGYRNRDTERERKLSQETGDSFGRTSVTALRVPVQVSSPSLVLSVTLLCPQTGRDLQLPLDLQPK